jgi:DNA mismatch endonuclease (patch repair protein)
MADRVSEDVRSYIMRSISTTSTGPERRLGALLRGAGYRFAQNARDLPGTPDIAFRNRRKVVFVHGCFWHAHRCRKGRPPTSKTDYWNSKRTVNRSRDARVRRQLRQLGWRALTVWQCQLKDPDKVLLRVSTFLETAE